MSQQEENRRALHNMFEDYRAGTLADNISQHFTDDAVFEIHLPDRNSNAGHIGGVYQGIEELKQYVELLESTVAMQDFEFKSITAEGDMVVAVGREIGTVNATNKIYDGAFALVFHFRDGKICSYHAFSDLHMAGTFS